MSETPKAYAIEAAEGVVVHLDDSSDDDSFTLTVQRDGEAVESHEGVTATTVVDLGSDHFVASHIEPPSPDAEA